jgi:hypothetical protein
MRVNMIDAKFAGGHPQCLYWPEGHECAGVFKDMATILVERGFANAPKLRAQCEKFKYKGNAMDCCCHWILYNQLDFVNVPLKLEKMCKPHGYQVLFLPKFHCELNFIEQCWGFSKRLYCQYPASSKEADLERNVLTALDSVPLMVMRRFIFSYFNNCLFPVIKFLMQLCYPARCFIDAYRKGLQGKGAA